MFYTFWMIVLDPTTYENMFNDFLEPFIEQYWAAEYEHHFPK